MNQSLIRAALKIGAGYFIAKGITDDATAETIISGLVAIIAVLWGVWHRGASAAAAAKVPLLLALGAAALFFTGCADLSGNAFKAEYAAAASSDAAMKGYAAYYTQAVATPEKFNRTANGLKTERQKLSDLSIKIGGAIELAENLRVAYATNSAVKPQLQAAVTSLTLNAAGIVATASSFLTTTNK